MVKISRLLTGDPWEDFDIEAGVVANGARWLKERRGHQRLAGICLKLENGEA
jgi:hypothetical protein